MRTDKHECAPSFSVSKHGNGLQSCSDVGVWGTSSRAPSPSGPATRGGESSEAEQEQEQARRKVVSFTHHSPPF
eukprot:gene12837-biopygen6474